MVGRERHGLCLEAEGVLPGETADEVHWELGQSGRVFPLGVYLQNAETQ